ncbi:type II toxin-antitoxin system death-on-curing family toxin [Mycobacteroides abscessus]|uniref:type II toxin-antitoxin system death-on-curing family toxin n=1 Tax=Mycobacteroides abscessus TaxID=36809 RepID=UPI0005E13BF7|nr:type II toxin-antitoxin system death-on-curing family toxin [Mycobacteroides abscessus]CPW71548.1 death-on-curing family protein [Mycobacteroides abscessus]SKF62116.1 death-on-curing family protein [Mycobacteroides abscessus subsp. bolletii]SKH91709.1 death-on-curing family protein [Mycobacteroides abscessus subsp. bolletii]
MTYAPSFDDLVALNHDITGGVRVINANNLHSALGRPFHTFGGQLLYPTVVSQAGALLEGLVAAHGFEDGNKRTAWIATKTFLIINDIPVRKVRHTLAADFVEGVALHTYSGEHVAQWLAAELVGH